MEAVMAGLRWEKKRQARPKDRQAGQEAGNIRNQNKQPQHAGTTPPCVVAETPRMSQARERVLGCSARRVHVGCSFPAGPASQLLDGLGFRRDALPWAWSLHNGGRLEAQAGKGGLGLAFFHRPSHIPEPAFWGWQEEGGKRKEGKMSNRDPKWCPPRETKGALNWVLCHV